MFKHCPRCGEDVQLSQWEAHRRRHGRGGRGASKQAKQIVKRRQFNRCATCDRDDVPLQVHHIDGNWRNNALHNLIGLCPDCHVEADAELGVRSR